MKNFKRYFAEFLMIFLAVVLGFFAENMRENFGQRAKENEFVIELIKELEIDTMLIHRNVPYGREYVSALDSLIDETYKYVEGKGDTRKMYYYYHHYLRGTPAFDPELIFRTVDLLKTTAEVDIIQNYKVKQLIIYIASIESLNKNRSEMLERYRQSAIDLGLNIFDFRVYQQATADSAGHISGGATDRGTNDHSEELFLKLSNQPSLISKDPVLLKKFAGLVGLYRNNENTNLNVYPKSIATRFGEGIVLIAKEYGIDNEMMQRIHLEVIENK